MPQPVTPAPISIRAGSLATVASDALPERVTRERDADHAAVSHDRQLADGTGSAADDDGDGDSNLH